MALVQEHEAGIDLLKRFHRTPLPMSHVLEDEIFEDKVAASEIFEGRIVADAIFESKAMSPAMLWNMVIPFCLSVSACETRVLCDTC